MLGNLPRVTEWSWESRDAGSTPCSEPLCYGNSKGQARPTGHVKLLLQEREAVTSTRIWFLERGRGYTSLNSQDPVTKLLKCMDVTGWGMHEANFITDNIIKFQWVHFVPYQGSHQQSLPFRLSVTNSVRFGSGLEKALWKHTGSSSLYLGEMSLSGYRPEHCSVPLLSEEQGSTSENKCSQLSCPGCALSPLQG